MKDDWRPPFHRSERNGTDRSLSGSSEKMKHGSPHRNTRLAVTLFATALIIQWGNAAMAMTLNSTEFQPNGHIPSKYTCEGEDVSPPLTWEGVPDGAKSLILIVDDPDAPDPQAPKMVWVNAITNATQTTDIKIIVASLRSAEDIKTAINSAGQTSGAGLVAFPDSLPITHKNLIITEASRLKLPAIFPFRLFPVSGGLMSYGLDIAEVYRQTAVYTSKILQGASPAELPVQAPSKFELVINLRTAKTLGLSLLASADEVIE
jgi:phosphatidylethanolamine-binding protein (PEBP) family uncharacterized protein